MEGMTLSEQLLEYLKTQLQFEEEDIEAHKQLTNEEKVEEGLLIRDAEVIDAVGHDYILRAEEDNTKMRVGDKVKIFFEGGRGVGRITDIGLNQFTVTTDIELPTDRPVNIEIMCFTFLQPMIDLMEKITLDELPGKAFVEYLSGDRVPVKRGLGALPTPIFDGEKDEDKFNEMQQLVIEEAVKRPSLYCIQGPPGTGKTAVLSRLAEEFASKGKEVLVISNTHQAVNNALNKIASRHPGFNVVKIGETVQGSNLLPNIFVCDTYNSYLSLRKERKREKCGDVIGMTLHGAIVNLGLRNTGFKPQVILVDEAGQIPMPYASVIGSFGCGSVIFIGDDKQMPPIFHPNLVGHPFSTSIFKYICDKYPELRKTLNVTYRMNDEICKFVTHCFYDTEEEQDVIMPSEYSAHKRANLAELTGINDKRISEVLCSDTSICAIDVTPTDAQCEDSNLYEATFVAEIAKILDMNGIKPRDYAIITPYRRQVKLIRSLVGDNEKAPLINTVECLQGQDVEYIFITFSASDPAYVREQLDFLLNPNRLNVMISRAKRKAVLVMSKPLMKEFFKRYDANLPLISTENS